MSETTTSPRLGPRFQEALGYAAALHNTQTRKASEVPYVGHLLSVAGLVIEADGTETEAIAALLHDAAEDQGGEATLAEIEQRFGPGRRGDRRRMQRHRRHAQAAVASAQGELHRAPRQRVGQHDPGVDGRQARQRACHPSRPPQARAARLEAVQHRRPARASLVLPVAAGGVPEPITTAGWSTSSRG